MRATTEWTETVDAGWNMLVDLDPAAARGGAATRPRRPTGRRCTGTVGPASGSSRPFVGWPDDRWAVLRHRRRRADPRDRAARRARRRASRHGDRRGLRGPGRRGAGQAAEARAALDGGRAAPWRAARDRGGRGGLRRRDRLRRRLDRRGRDHRRPGVRPRALARSGARTVIGRGSAVDNDVVVGERVRVQTDVYLTAYSVVEDDVFVGPGVLTTNDSTMSRHDRSYELRGAILRRACRIGGGGGAHAGRRGRRGGVRRRRRGRHARRAAAQRRHGRAGVASVRRGARRRSARELALMSDPLRPPEVTRLHRPTPPPGAGGPPVAPSSGALDRPARALGLAWPRVGAQIIDGLIVGVGALRAAGRAHGAVLDRVLRRRHVRRRVADRRAVDRDRGVSIVALLYAPAMMARTNGRTIGRMATGIRVVRANGSRSTSASRCCARSPSRDCCSVVDPHGRSRRLLARRPVAVVGRGEPRAARLRRGHAHDRRLRGWPAGVRRAGGRSQRPPRSRSLVAPGPTLIERDRHADELRPRRRGSRGPPAAGRAPRGSP